MSELSPTILALTALATGAFTLAMLQVLTAEARNVIRYRDLMRRAADMRDTYQRQLREVERAGGGMPEEPIVVDVIEDAAA